MQSSPLNTSNVHTLDNGYLQGIFPPNYALNHFLELYLHPATLLIKDFRSAQIIDGVLSDFWY